MLVVSLIMLPEQQQIDVNLESVGVVKDGPAKPKEKGPDEKTAVLCLNSGLVLHVQKGRKDLVGMMKNYRGG